MLTAGWIRSYYLSINAARNASGNSARSRRTGFNRRSSARPGVSEFACHIVMVEFEHGPAFYVSGARDQAFADERCRDLSGSDFGSAWTKVTRSAQRAIRKSRAREPTTSRSTASAKSGRLCLLASDQT
jgi:hypothetical protein